MKLVPIDYQHSCQKCSLLDESKKIIEDLVHVLNVKTPPDIKMQRHRNLLHKLMIWKEKERSEKEKPINVKFEQPNVLSTPNMLATQYFTPVHYNNAPLAQSTPANPVNPTPPASPIASTPPVSSPLSLSVPSTLTKPATMATPARPVGIFPNIAIPKHPVKLDDVTVMDVDEKPIDSPEKIPFTKEQLQEYIEKSIQENRGINLLYRRAKAVNSKITLKDVKTFLSKQDSYILHVPVRRKFARNKTRADGLFSHIQADLADMQKLKEYNDGYSMIFTAVDVFSRKTFAIPLKSKRPLEIKRAFETITQSDGGWSLQNVITDQGTEFYNKIVSAYFKENHVNHYSVFNNLKSAQVERFNRTLKERLYRYMTAKSTNRWVDALEQVVYNINSTPNRTTGIAPEDVNFQNAHDLLANQYKDNNKKAKFKFNVGDAVRIVKSKAIFRKGYLPNFTYEIFHVKERLPRNPPVYRITDFTKTETIRGSFYEQELIKVCTKDKAYRIEEILKTRKRNGSKEYFVRFLGYRDNQNAWVKEEDIVSVADS
uniref:Integrase catalytic domain-containing protein n=1 Tax=Steinernema glaseri TaxID=37863 RepID=A0A1I7ZTB0_9BILA